MKRSKNILDQKIPLSDLCTCLRRSRQAIGKRVANGDLPKMQNGGFVVRALVHHVDVLLTQLADVRRELGKARATAGSPELAATKLAIERAKLAKLEIANGERSGQMRPASDIAAELTVFYQAFVDSIQFLALDIGNAMQIDRPQFPPIQEQVNKFSNRIADLMDRKYGITKESIAHENQIPQTLAPAPHRIEAADGQPEGQEGKGHRKGKARQAPEGPAAS